MVGATQKLEVAIRYDITQEMFGVVDAKIYVRRTDRKHCLGPQRPGVLGAPHGE